MKKYRPIYRAQNLERLRAEEAAYYWKNTEKVKAARAAYYAQNTEKMKIAQAAYRIANPEQHAAYSRNRNARRKAAEGSHTGEDIQRIYKAQNGKCACCEKRVGKNYDTDHIVPLAKGGSNWPTNLQILCPRCNRSKQDKDPIEFMQSRGMLL